MTSPPVLLHPAPSRTATAPQVRVVAPDAVPAGATVIGVLVVDGAPVPAVPLPRVLAIPDRVAVDADSRQAVADGAVLPLTRREFDLLHRLSEAPGRVFPRERLLREVWGYDSDAYVSGRTVDVHVTRLRSKLGTHAHRLQTVRGVGYRWTQGR